MLGSAAPDLVRARHRSVRPETTRSHGRGEHIPASQRTISARRRRGSSEQKQKLAAGEIYNVDTLVQCGFVMEDDSVPSLRLHTERRDVTTHRTLDTPEGQLSLRDAAERRDAVREGDRRELSTDRTGGVIEPGDDFDGDKTRGRTHPIPGEHEASLYSEGDSRLSVEAVWGSSSSGARSVQDRLQLKGKPAAWRRGAERDSRAEATAVRYLLGGEETADGRKIEETTIRCIKAGAGAAAARRRRFRQGNVCARLATWAQSPGDTAFHPVPPPSKPEMKFEKRGGAEASPCLLPGGSPERRNYHLHAQKPPLPAGPGKDSLVIDMPDGEEDERRGMDISASLIFLDPRTHRLKRRQASVKLTPSAPSGGNVIDADGVQTTKTFTPGVARAAEHLPLLTDAKSLETTAKLLEAFERCHPDAAGWLLTSDIRWALPRDLRVQEIFGLKRKQQSNGAKSVKEGTGKQWGGEGHDHARHQKGADGTCFFSWAKELLRNRDEPVRFALSCAPATYWTMFCVKKARGVTNWFQCEDNSTRTSQIKYEAMIDQLRRVESSLINNDRVSDALKISFDIFCRAFWPFTSGTPADAAAYEGAGTESTALPIALEKENPYVLTPMQMLVRDALLGVRLSPYEVRLPDYVECGHLPLMERPDLTLAEEGGTLQMQPDEKRQLLEQFAKREEASSFEKTYSHVLKVESQLAEHELLKKALGKYSRMRFLSLPAEDLKKKISVARLSSIDE